MHHALRESSDRVSALVRYGGAYEQGHVVVFIAVTVIACIFCLTHLPIAAFTVTFIVMGTFIPYYLSSGNIVLAAIALNVLFVTIVMVRILSKNFLDFKRLIETQAETQRLIDLNEKLALTDSLTELPNRRFFFKRLNHLIENLDGKNEPFALAIFDLDRFKPINDTYGHNAGDRVLIEAGRRITAFSTDEVIVARLGGDEFGMIITQAASIENVIAVCDDICQIFQVPILLGETLVVTGCSGGVALYPSAGRTADELFDRADYALYFSKQGGRGTITVFSREHEDSIRAERAIEAALQSVGLTDEMAIHYQPIMDLSSNTIAFVEGLARWTSPTIGEVPPDRFIAAAERCGMIHALMIMLLRKALKEAVHLPKNIGLSFNLSSHDLMSSSTVISILAVIRESGFSPHRLTLELTETALMRDFEGALISISTLRAAGIKIALDDFGTGYSSLNYVHRLPLDKVKIDRSFVSRIETEIGGNIVTTILDLCLNLGLDCVSEGVETPQQLLTLRRHGCRYVQGYLIGKALPIEQLLPMLQTQSYVTDKHWYG